MNRAVALCAVFLSLAAWGGSSDVSFTRLPPGYVAGKVPLGNGNYAQALAPDPDNENFVYAAGLFGGANRIVRVNLATGVWTSVFTCPTTVTVSGFAVLNAQATFVSDNWHDHIYALLDNNPQDGDFDDPGELRDLITPILTNPGGDWTGTAVLALRGDSARLGLPPNTILFQSEDGGTTQAEVLAVVNPTTAPAYQPPGGAFFSGFNYGGGLALDSVGRLLVASSFYPNNGRIWICDDLNHNGVIGPGESNFLVPQASPTTESAGLSGLAADVGDHVYTTVGWGFGSSAQSDIQQFLIPRNPLSDKAPVMTWASLNSPYVSALIFNSPSRPFTPWAQNGATMVLAVYDSLWGNPEYLLTLKPVAPSGRLGAKRWKLY